MAVLQRKQVELGDEHRYLHKNLNEKTTQARCKRKIGEDPHCVNIQGANSQQTYYSWEYRKETYERRYRLEQRRNNCADSIRTPSAAHRNQKADSAFHRLNSDEYSCGQARSHDLNKSIMTVSKLTLTTTKPV